MQTGNQAAHRQGIIAPFLLACVVASLICIAARAQEEPGARQKQPAPVQKRPVAAAVKGPAAIEPAPLPEAVDPPAGGEDLVAEPAPLPPFEPLPPELAKSSAPVSGAASALSLPLRNIDLLNKMDEDRLPTRPRHLLKLRFNQVRRAQDEKILHLLLVCVGFVGVFIAILALRSVPPSRPSPN